MKRIMTVLLMLAASMMSANATVVFSDDFEGTAIGSRDGWHTVTQSSNLDAGVIDDSAGLGSGKALSFVNKSSSTARGIVANFSDVTLSPDEFIRLSFDVRAGSADEYDDDFRFGLFNNQGTALTSDESSSGTSDNDDKGYFCRGSGGTTQDFIELVEDNGGTTILGGSAISIQGVSSNTTTLLPWSDPVPAQAMDLEIRMNADGDLLLLDLWIDGVLAVSGDDGGGSAFTTTFNEVGFASNSNVDFVIDNVVVETGVIPEPGTASMLALGMTAVIWFRRRCSIG